MVVSVSKRRSNSLHVSIQLERGTSKCPCPIADFRTFLHRGTYQEQYSDVSSASLHRASPVKLFDAHTKSHLSIRHGKAVHVLEYIMDKATVMHEEMIATRVHLEN